MSMMVMASDNASGRHSVNRQRLNDISVHDLDIDYYANWVQVFVNGGKLPPTPEWYKPVMAYMQLMSMNPSADSRPWDIPPQWVDILATVWIGNRVASEKMKAKALDKTRASGNKTTRGRTFDGGGVV